jgi:hypothetical protein
MSQSNDVQAIQSRIDVINARLASGVTSVTTDGTTTQVDLRTLEKERDRLDRQLVSQGQPTAASIDLSHG